MARKNLESEFRKEMKSIFDNISCMGDQLHISWVESHETSPGIPDIEYCINGDDGRYSTTGNIELKVLGENMEVRSSQLQWFRKRTEAGGRPLVFVRVHIDSPRTFLPNRDIHIKQDIEPGIYAVAGGKVPILHKEPDAGGLWRCCPSILRTLGDIAHVLRYPEHVK